MGSMNLAGVFGEGIGSGQHINKTRALHLSANATKIGHYGRLDA